MFIRLRFRIVICVFSIFYILSYFICVYIYVCIYISFFVLCFGLVSEDIELFGVLKLLGFSFVVSMIILEDLGICFDLFWWEIC